MPSSLVLLSNFRFLQLKYSLLKRSLKRDYTSRYSISRVLHRLLYLNKNIRGPISQGALQPLVVPASQCLGDVTHVGIGCLLAAHPKMTTHCTPLLAPTTRALLSASKQQKQRGSCQFWGETRDHLTEHRINAAS